MLLVVDNGSVYTQHLIDFLKKKTPFQVFSHNKIDTLNFSNYESFILSGRRKNDKQMNILNSKIIKYTIQEKKSLLGICYGAEILTLALGGTIKKSDFMQKGSQEVKISIKNPLCKGKINVFESHSYEISSLGDSLESIAYSNSCKNEIINIKNSNVFGTQFHPEMTNDGKKLIEKFCYL